MERFEFAVIAQENTEHWNLPDDSTLKDCLAFTLGIFCVGERTHVCSLTPSTYVDEFENVFINRDGSPLTDAQNDELDRSDYQYLCLDGSYIDYVKPERIASSHLIGEIYWTELDPTDYMEGEEGEEAMRHDAWEEARDEMRANSGYYEPALIPSPAMAE